MKQTQTLRYLSLPRLRFESCRPTNGINNLRFLNRLPLLIFEALNSNRINYSGRRAPISDPCSSVRTRGLL